MSLRDRRVQYETAGLDRIDLNLDPIVQWNLWYEEAASAGVAEPNAMTVSTIDKDSAPDSRIVRRAASTLMVSCFIQIMTVQKVCNYSPVQLPARFLHGLTCTDKFACGAPCTKFRRNKVMTILLLVRANLNSGRGLLRNRE